MKARKFSVAQMCYVAARAAFEVARKDSRDYDVQIDAECEKLGIKTPYGILPDSHPMLPEAQRLLDVENAATKDLYAAAHALFDWATESTLARIGTPTQKAAIRAMVTAVKKKAFVEQPFIVLVDMSMQLAAV